MLLAETNSGGQIELLSAIIGAILGSLVTGFFSWLIQHSTINSLAAL